jgi:hypothetical protein
MKKLLMAAAAAVLGCGLALATPSAVANADPAPDCAGLTGANLQHCLGVYSTPEDQDHCDSRWYNSCPPCRTNADVQPVLPCDQNASPPAWQGSQ